MPGILFYSTPLGLGGELPPAEEGPGENYQWVSIFDNSVWGFGTDADGSDQSWVGNKILIDKTIGNDIVAAHLIPIGNWITDFRPDQVRVTIQDIDFTISALNNVDLRVGNGTNLLNPNGPKTIWTGPTGDLAGQPSDDIALLYINSVYADVGSFYITNIEFYYDINNPPDEGGSWPGGTGGGGG
jgi:hypothetical protein